MVNAVGLLYMLADKYRAKKNLWRIPEARLMFIAAIGGSIGILAGITGGYLWGYLPAAAVLSALRVFLSRRMKNHRILSAICAAIPALLLCYLCGTVQFLCLTDSTTPAALAVCVLPFLPFDMLKLACAVTLSARFRRHL
ncbi:MAG: DUF1294 domain-containing protein [Clostridia bacterium]|nr:DUF1294 domain-containing protein [Clostridia bacterium]